MLIIGKRQVFTIHIFGQTFRQRRRNAITPSARPASGEAVNVQIVKCRAADKCAFDRTDEIVLEVEAGKAFQVQTDNALTGLSGATATIRKCSP